MNHPMTLQKPTPAQVAALEYLAPFYRAAYDAILQILPPSEERAEAMKLIRGARMWGNAATVFTPDEELTVPKAEVTPFGDLLHAIVEANCQRRLTGAEVGVIRDYIQGLAKIAQAEAEG